MIWTRIEQWLSRYRCISLDRQLNFIWVLCCLLTLLPTIGFSQQPTSGGFHKYEGKHILLITDVPPTPEVEELTAAFDVAVTHWTGLFHADPVQVSQWRVAAYLMTDRERFENAGYIDPNIREFREGHQEGDLIFCKDQPSSYYQRHLLLHEGVHWFMEKALGGYGPGWWMEGIAEWQATHRWEGNRLICGVMPASREELPYWGRLKWVREDLASNQAPSLPVLFQKAKELHRFDSTYAWSWMAVTFLANHPRYREQFLMRLSQPTDESDALTKDVLQWFKEDLTIVQAEFDLFADELDYGIDPASVVFDLKHAISQSTLQIDAPKMTLACNSGWQLYPMALNAGKSRIEAEGRINFSYPPLGRIVSEPQGVTLQYHQGKPIAQLIAVLVPKEVSLESTLRFEKLSIGKGKEIVANQSSWLLLRANFSQEASKLAEGSYGVQVEPIADGF